MSLNRSMLALSLGLAAIGSAPRRRDDLAGTPLADLELGPLGIQRKPRVTPPDIVRGVPRRRQPNWSRFERITGRSDEDILERQKRGERKRAKRAWEAGHRYSAALIQRDSDGQFLHPHLPEPDTDAEVDLTPFLHAQGYDITATVAEFEDAWEAGDEAYWNAMRAWQPEPPEGEGWKLAAILDTEDGPRAWWVRPRSVTPTTITQDEEKAHD